MDYIQPFINGRAGDRAPPGLRPSWDKARLKSERTDNRGSIPVEIYNLDGTLEFLASSNNEASKFINMSYKNLHLYLNNAKPFFSPNLDKFVTLRTPGFKGEIVLRSLTHQLINTSPLVLPHQKLEDLSPMFLYCFDEDKKNFTTFFTLTQAYRALFSKQYEEQVMNKKGPTGVLNVIKNKINLAVPVLAENGLKYYFAGSGSRYAPPLARVGGAWAEPEPEGGGSGSASPSQRRGAGFATLGTPALKIPTRNEAEFSGWRSRSLKTL
jgi:hypothetical protein